MATLRQYQRELVESVISAWDGGARAVMMQLPTGGGKTLVAAEIAQRGRRSQDGGRGGRVVVITHRRELEAQTKAAFIQLGLPPTLVDTVHPVRGRNLDIAAASTERDILIVDEAHHSTASTWRTSIERWRGRVLGLTATPWRLSLKEGFDHLYDALTVGAQPLDLVDGGYLAPIRVITDPVIRGAGKNSTGDYSAAATMRRNQNDVLIENAVDWLQELGLTDERTIAYCIGIEHAKGLAAAANEAGIPSGVVFGASDQPPEERDATIAAFGRGDIRLIANCEVVTEGFDLPEASICLMLRPTESLTLYLQMVGRVRRPLPGKTAILLDSTDNTERLGLPDKEREWTLEPRSDTEGEAPIKGCPNCGSENYTGAHKCAARCGYEYGRACPPHPLGCGEWRSWDNWTDANTRSAIRCSLCVGNETPELTKKLGGYHSAAVIERERADEAERQLADMRELLARTERERDWTRNELAAARAALQSERERTPTTPPEQARTPNPEPEGGVVWSPVASNPDRKYARIEGYSVTCMPNAYGTGFGYMAYGSDGLASKRFRGLRTMEAAQSAAIRACERLAAEA